MNIKLGNVKAWGWQVLPILIVIAARVIFGLSDFSWTRLLTNVWILGGWVLGWLFVDLEQSKWVVANWPVTKYGPVRNVLVTAVVGAMGLWVISSSGSNLAAGFVWGVGVRLLSELVKSPDTSKWFAVFARPFSQKEQRVFVFGFGIVTCLCGYLLIGY